MRCLELIQICRGDYVMGLADNDIIIPKFLNDSQHIIQKHKNIGLIFSDMY